MSLNKDIQERLDLIYKEFYDEFCNMDIVVGQGNPNSGIVLIGEAPGKEEVKLGKPFVGSAGKILQEFIDTLGITRDDLFITNAIKYRLCKVNEKTSGLVNRPAKKDDINNCKHYLIKELLVLNPKVIVTLGNVPMNVLVQKTIKIGDVHGRLLDLPIEDKSFNLYPMYHPASLIYNRSLYDTYKQDMENLGELIRQRKII